MFPLLCLLTLTACRSLPPPPAADLSDAAWTVRQGQAVWKQKRGAPEIAGEILVATQTNGRSFVQFTKTPFPLVIAQTATNSWQLEIPAQNRRFAFHGAPPSRVIWFQLPRALAGATLPKKFAWQTSPAGWRLENSATGEALEGYFSQ